MRSYLLFVVSRVYVADRNLRRLTVNTELGIISLVGFKSISCLVLACDINGVLAVLFKLDGRNVIVS